MQVNVIESLLETGEGKEAEAILRNCVHCGFCNATCPTYLELGDERDGPRGRIYLIKQFLETGSATAKTQYHLDRCLTCQSCETTCPSGVNYSRLVDIARVEMESVVKRSLHQTFLRWSIRKLIPHKMAFASLLKCGQFFRPVLPRSLKDKIPPVQTAGQLPEQLPEKIHNRTMLLLSACAQSAAKPNTNAAAMRVLNSLGVTLKVVDKAGCCGALSHHLSANDEAKIQAKRNIDAWWPAIEAGAEAVVITASGCGTMIKGYGALLKNDQAYAEKAEKVSALARDISEVLLQEDLSKLIFREDRLRTVVHCPCSLQHGQGLPDSIEKLLINIGVHTVEGVDKHICCGSAGSYSILQPDLSAKLLKNKLRGLMVSNPDRIVTGNIGCQMHMESKSTVPVFHWIEIIDQNIVYKDSDYF